MTPMREWERFRAIMDYRPFDRLPVWYFGVWNETLTRWQTEGLSGAIPDIPAATGMDPAWEEGMWEAHDMVRLHPESPLPLQVLEEGEDYRVVRTSLGAVVRERKGGSSIPQHVEEALKPTRESWRTFRRCMDPQDTGRRAADWEAKAAALAQRDRVNVFFGGSLFGGTRDWMGVEAISYLAYDDPALYEEIIAHLFDFYTEMYRPILKHTRVDMVYIFEDCCGRSGPLLSPDLYRRYFHKYYVRLIEFCRSCGAAHVLVDSDGWVEPLIPCWMESGFDVLFPIEVGVWDASTMDLRRKFGRRLRFLGGVDKRVIPLGEAAIRRALEPLVPLAREGGFIPIPDHRIPPDTSFEQFCTYVRLFREIFAP